jgi:hypothetical protein
MPPFGPCLHQRLPGDRGAKAADTPEVVDERGCGDTQLAGEAAEGQGGGTVPHDELTAAAQGDLAQVAMVVGALPVGIAGGMRVHGAILALLRC